ncbi:unnamed protein product, partial [Closterium sp. NIES-54]
MEPPYPCIAAAALGASESGTHPGTAPAHALHTFKLDSGTSRNFFHDSTTLTPLPAPVPVRQADPSGGPVVARSSNVLPCPADAMVTTSNFGGQRVSICTCTRTGRHLATFTHRPGSTLYTLATKPPQVAASAQVSASSQVAASCLCRLLSNQTLLWHHRLGHPSLPRLRGMHSRFLAFGLPRSLPPLPPSPAPPCLPCNEGRRRAAPHSSSVPPTIAPLHTLHMDVWGPAGVSRQGRERYFLLVVEDYTRYTTVFPLRSKGEVVDVLIPWIRTVRLQLRERFGQDLPVIRLHSDRGGEFFSNLLRDFCREEGILQSFTLPDSPQQNEIAERRIGLVMEVARTSMIHAAAPHFLWPFAVRYATHQLNLWPHKLSTRAIPCVFLGFVPDVPGWQFYHPTLRRVFPYQDVTFDKSVPFCHLFLYRSAPPPSPPLFLAPGPPPVDPLLPQGPAPSRVSQVDPLPCTAPIQVADGSGAAPGTASGRATSRGADPGGAESEGAGSGGAEPGGESLGVLSLRVWRMGVWSLGALELEELELEALAREALELEELELLTLELESGSLTERREPASHPLSPVRTTCRIPCSCPPPVPDTHAMALRPSSVPLRIPLPAPLESSLPEVPDLESDRARAASPTVSRLLASAVTDPSFESSTASSLVAELLDFATACRLDYVGCKFTLHDILPSVCTSMRVRMHL